MFGAYSTDLSISVNRKRNISKERLPNRTAKLTLLLTLTVSLIRWQSNTVVLPLVICLWDQVSQNLQRWWRRRLFHMKMRKSVKTFALHWTMRWSTVQTMTSWSCVELFDRWWRSQLMIQLCIVVRQYRRRLRKTSVLLTVTVWWWPNISESTYRI